MTRHSYCLLLGRVYIKSIIQKAYCKVYKMVFEVLNKWGHYPLPLEKTW